MEKKLIRPANSFSLLGYVARFIPPIFMISSLLNAQDDSSPLDEMRAIEAQIRAKLIEQAQRDSKISELDQSRRLAEEMLRGDSQLRTDNQKFLKGIEDSLGRDLSALETAISDTRQILDHSRSAIQLAAAMTLQNARDHGPADRRTALAAILQTGHREQAQWAIEQSLKLEEVKSTRSDKKEKVGSQVNRYAELEKLPLKKLRSRHRELSSQVSKLNALSSGTQSTIAQLESRKNALNELVAGLASGALSAEEIRALDRSSKTLASQSSESTSPSGESQLNATASSFGNSQFEISNSLPPPGDIPEIPYDDEQTELYLGTREGDGEALLTLDIPDDDITPNQSSPRKSFWRAERSIIHSLADGKVLFGGAFAGYRHLLILDHGNGWTCLYGNIENCDLLEGATVKAGQPLGNYQTTEAQKSEPFWIEVREQTTPTEIHRLPGAGENWESKLFAE